MIKKFLVLILTFSLIGGISLLAGYGNNNGNGTGVCQFIDENGDGINDNFRDADGDGIPNYLDPDWVKPEDGTGYQTKHQYKRGNRFNNQTTTTSTSQFHNYGGNFGNPLLDGEGPHGNSSRRGGGRG